MALLTTAFSKMGFNRKKHKNKESTPELTPAEREHEYLLKAQAGWERAVELYEDTSGWKREKGEGVEEGMVSTKSYSGMGKVFKLEGQIECPLQVLFDILVNDVSTTHHWNPTVGDAKILQVIDDDTDICYTVASESASGLVSSRDFVNVRHRKWRGKVMIAAGCVCTHPDAPVTSKHVRGENRPGGAWIFVPVEGHPNRTVFCWIMNTDIKGWLPQWTVDQALVGTQMEFLQHLRTRVANKLQGKRTLHSV